MKTGFVCGYIFGKFINFFWGGENYLLHDNKFFNTICIFRIKIILKAFVTYFKKFAHHVDDECC